MTRAVWEVYSGLPEEEQAECVIVARNYGEAGAIDYYGKEYGLPPVISAHNSYFLWGPGSRPGNVTIVVGVSRDLIEDVFNHISPAATDVSSYAMPYEINAPVFLCRGRKVPLEVFWSRIKMYI
jgi:hypothetical protein